jgi:hypothetical protein
MIDIKDFYLNTPMKQYKYMQLKMLEIPEEIIKEYKLNEILTEDGYILQNTKRDVRLTSSWNNSPRTPQRTHCQTWMYAEQNNTWPLETLVNGQRQRR